MTRVLSVIFSLIFMAAALPTQVQAATVAGFCADRVEAVKRLHQRYGERQVAVGLTSGGALMELLATRTGSSWSVLVTSPNGRSCLILFGSDWTNVPDPTDMEPIDQPEM